MCNRFKIIFAGLFFLFLGLSLNSVQAVNITSESGQTTLGPGEEYSADVVLNISADDGTTYYLRGVFYKAGTSDYCGYTWNGTSWFKGPYSVDEGWKNFLTVQVNSASWSGTLKAKLDTGNSGCSDSGDYRFKIQRFTAAGSPSFDSQNELALTVQIPTATPTPTQTPTPTSEPTDIPPTSTPTPVPTSTPTLRPTATSTKKPTPTPLAFPTEEAASEEAGRVQGEEIGLLGGVENQTSQGKTGSSSALMKGGKILFPALAIAAGLGFVGFSVFTFFKARKLPKQPIL